MKFIFTCGGTAGHINPALAVAGRLRSLMPDCDILFIGAEGKMETQLVPRAGYEIKTLTITNISRGHNLDAVCINFTPFKMVFRPNHRGRRSARPFNPAAVSGTAAHAAYRSLPAPREPQTDTMRFLSCGSPSSALACSFV